MQHEHENFDFGGEIAWRPTREQIAQSNINAFLKRHSIADYPALLKRSCEDIEWFWRAVLEDVLKIRWRTPCTRY